METVTQSIAMPHEAKTETVSFQSASRMLSNRLDGSVTSQRLDGSVRSSQGSVVI